MALEPPSSPAVRSTTESRRTVTVALVELVDSAGSAEDPETGRAVGQVGLEHVRETVESYGGTADGLPDGSVLAVFGSPLAHEDDSVRAFVPWMRFARRSRLPGRHRDGRGAHGPEHDNSREVVRTAARLMESARAR